MFLNDTFIINCIFKSILGRGKIHRRTQTFASWNTLNLGTGWFIIIFTLFWFNFRPVLKIVSKVKLSHCIEKKTCKLFFLLCIHSWEVKQVKLGPYDSELILLYTILQHQSLTDYMSSESLNASRDRSRIDYLLITYNDYNQNIFSLLFQKLNEMQRELQPLKGRFKTYKSLPPVRIYQLFTLYS